MNCGINLSLNEAQKSGPAKLAGDWHWPRKIAGGLEPAILSSDRFRRRLAARFAAVLEQLALGAGPVLKRISGRAAALQKDLVGAQGDLFRCRMGPGCAGLRYCWRGTFPRLGHIPSFRQPLHVTSDGKPPLQNSLGSYSKDSIVRIEKTISGQ